MALDGDALKAQYQFAMDRAAARLAALESLPAEDPYEDGQMLRIKRNFGLSKVYTYLALRVEDLWYLTGEKHYRYGSTRSREPIGPGVSWQVMRNWLIESGDMQQLEIAELSVGRQVI